MTRCIGEPISWLVLERYGLSELSGAERESVAQHLGACAACRECWKQIEADGGRDLQPLAAGAAGAGAGAAVLPLRRPQRARRAWAWTLAAAAAALLVVWRGHGPGLEPPESRKTIKGGELAIELVRLGADGTLREPTQFHPDDRFKVLLTCPPPRKVFARVVVYQGGRAYLPLETERVEACGNRLGLSGALRVDGEEPAVVCVVMAEDALALDRERLSVGLRGLPEESVCEELAPAPGG